MIKKWDLFNVSLKGKLTLGMGTLFLIGLFSIFVIINNVVRDIIHDNVVAIAQHEKLTYANKVSEWFSIAGQRVYTLGSVLSALSSEDEYISILRQVFKDNELESIFVGLNDGRLMNANGWKLPEGTVAEERPWFDAALEAGPGRIALAPPFISLATGNKAVSFSLYLPELSEVGGVVGTGIDIDFIINMIQEYSTIDIGYLILVADDKSIVVHTGDLIYSQGLEFFNLEDIPMGDFFSGMMKTDEQVVSFQDEYLGNSYVISTSLEGIDWHLLAVIPDDMIRNQVFYYTAIIMIVMAFIFLSLFTVLMTFLVKVTEGLEEKRISEKRLAAAYAQERGASQAKSSFFSNMSHEIRTPMNAILGMTQIGKKAETSRDKDYAFEKIEGASTHLLGIINDVLDMSKIEAGKLEIYQKGFDFEHMIQKAVNLVEVTMAKKWHRFTVSMDPHIPHRLLSDEQKLTQVIVNLLGNAVKFTPPEGSIHLEASLLGEMDDIYSIMISITDSGIGISPEKQQRLFDSFNQLDAEISRKYGGTGLGLLISKNIVELLGGTLWVESDDQKGSSFSFTIFAKKDEMGLVCDLPLSATRSGKVLLVDDNLDMLVYLRNLVEKNNIPCDTASTTAEVDQRLRENGPYQLCMIDVESKISGGMELARTLKDSSEIAKVVALYTRYNWIGLNQQGAKDGIDEYLSKPLFTSNVRECLSRHLLPHPEVAGHHFGTPASIQSFKGYRVLLVEDLEINQEIFETLLKGSGLEVEFAFDGIEAISKVSKNPHAYDLIFMDLQMPKMDGLTATRMLKLKYKDLPIIAMTADVFQETIDDCFLAGMDDYISKPVSLKLLLDTLNLHLKKK